MRRWQKGGVRSIMSISISNCLLCQEDSSDVVLSPGSYSDLKSPTCVEESIAVFMKDERDFVPHYDHCLSLDAAAAAARLHSVSWILKVQAYYGFQPLTAYLSVNYLDRFLSSRPFPQTNGWALQLLSVACLSLAAKMEEPLVPALLDLQVEGAKYIFEARTICRMELVVVRVLDWRLRSITPFNFIAFFACKLDPSGNFLGFLTSRATQIILSNIREVVMFMEYWPSCIAAAALLCAANEVPDLCVVDPEHAESWCRGLSKENMMGCYRLMQEIMVDSSCHRIKSLEMLPKFRVSVRSSDLSSCSSSSSSSCCCSSLPNKRRKVIRQRVWVDDDKGSTQE